MNKIKNQRFLFTFIIIFVSCTQTQQNDSDLSDPKIEVGVAKISGKIIDLRKEPIQEISTLSLYISNLIGGNDKPFEILVNKDGSFSYETLISISPERAVIGLNPQKEQCIITLIPNQETKLEITCNEDSNLEIKAINGSNVFFSSQKEYDHSSELLTEAAITTSDNELINANTINLFIANPEEYISYFIKYNLNPRLEVIKKDSILNEREKEHYINIITLVMYYDCLLETSFGDEMSRLHDIIKAKGDATTFIMPEEPDKSYFSFLKSLNLNNPLYLCNVNYSRVCQSILANNTLNINRIEETPIDEWLQGVKAEMADLLGFGEGQFYDVLIANAYSKQFIEEKQPLSEKQLENIKNYYKGEGLEKSLLSNNETIVRLASEKSK